MIALDPIARASSFPDETWFVDLAAVTDACAVGLAAAGVFGVTQQTGKTITQSLVDSLGARRLLLILDNCEHSRFTVSEPASRRRDHCRLVAAPARCRRTKRSAMPRRR